MKVAQLDITLLEPMSFATTQARGLVSTAPLIHPYALAFALGWAGRNGAKPNPYMTGQDLERLSDTGGADHKGMLSGMRFRLSGAQTISTKEVTRTLQRGQEGFRTAPVKPKDGAPEDHVQLGWYPPMSHSLKDKNIFQFGKSRELDTGTTLRAFAWGELPEFPQYIRLGRWMSKARVEVKTIDAISSDGPWSSELLLLPEDAPRGTEDFDVISMSPCSLIKHPSGNGPHLRTREQVIPI